VSRASSLVVIAQKLRGEVSRLRFGRLVYHAYNSLFYVWAPHREYLQRYSRARPETLIVGMNAGYFGIAQTGIPFGDVEIVRDWLAIRAPVRKPLAKHPRRPIEGCACRRYELSGQWLWGWAQPLRHTRAVLRY